LYYAGIGGNENKTTRFRKYTGVLADKAVIKEYTDSSHLIKGNKLYQITIVVKDGRSQLYVNNELYFDADDGVNGRELWKLNTSNVVGVSEPGIVDILVLSNPDTDHLSISGLERYQNVQVRLLDTAGRPLYSETMTDQTNSTIDVSNFPEGIYFLEMNTSETRRPMLKKLLIVR
jgi:hypothetical protein